MNELKHNTVESSELVEQTFDFWFNDKGHIRSPFPHRIRKKLKVNATKKFFDWANDINPKAQDELNDEMVGEKFEEIIFETALELADSENERITILYPFLPRLQDKLQQKDDEDSIVTYRFIIKKKDKSFLKVILEKNKTKEKWETMIELPV